MNFLQYPLTVFYVVTILVVGFCALLPVQSAAELRAFPGAEGFGANASGGRGGDVVYVTNLNPEGPGSLNEALGYLHENPDMLKPRYILFKISGLISPGSSWIHTTHIEHGDFTLAGHTSPGGVILPGLFTSCNGAERCDVDNMIIRHLRSRPAGRENALDDAIRLNNAQNVILDHCSFGRASDEVMQISYNKNFSVQNSLFAETLGSHADRGGVLVKYGSYQKPNTRISFHHNMFNRIQGRMPQVDCSDDKDDSYCRDGNSMELELSNNVMWDAGTPIVFKGSYLDESPMNHKYNVNLVNNYYYVRDSRYSSPYQFGMWAFYGDNSDNAFYVAGNKMNIYPDSSDFELFGWATYVHPNTNPVPGIHRSSRHSYPTIQYTPTEQLVQYMIQNVGAFPRDPMDRRLMSWVEREEIDPTHWSRAPRNDALQFDWSEAPLPPLDSDDDGMPDEWEICNGLDPLTQDHTGKQLSVRYTGVEGYDNLEVYLNRLSDHLVNGTALLEGQCRNYPVRLRAEASASQVNSGETIHFTITVPDGQAIERVALSLDLLEDPYQFPSPKEHDIKVGQHDRKWEYDYTVPDGRQAGNYSVLLALKNTSGENGYAIIRFGDDPTTQYFQGESAFHQLTIHKSGYGTIVSQPAGIDCGEGCVEAVALYQEESSVELVATARPGYIFSGWSEAHCGTETVCRVTMDRDTQITATFEEDSGEIRFSKEQTLHRDRGGSPSQPFVCRGDTISYSISAVNTFQSAISLVISDTLSPLVEYIASSLEINDEKVELNFSDQLEYAGELASGDAIEISFDVLVNQDALVRERVENTAVLTAYFVGWHTPFIRDRQSNTTSARVLESVAVPEPSTYLLLGSGLLLCALAKKTIEEKR